MFVIRLIVYLLFMILVDGYDDKKDLHQRRDANNMKQWLDREKKIDLISRKKRQTVIRNSQPGQKPQVTGIDLSPSVFIYLENEKDLETLLTNRTLDDIINTAERNIPSNSNSQYLSSTLVSPQYQQIQTPFINFNSQKPYNKIPTNAEVATTETVLVSYDQLNSYISQGSSIPNVRNQNNMIFIEVDDNVKFPQEQVLLPVTKSKPQTSTNPSFERDNTFQYPNTKEIPNSNHNQDNPYSGKPSVIPLSTKSITIQDSRVHDSHTVNSNNPYTQAPVENTEIKNMKSINSDEISQDEEISTKYDENSPYNRNVSQSSNKPTDSRKSIGPDRSPTSYDTPSSNYDNGPASEERRPSDYDRRLTSYDRRPTSFDRRPPDYDRRSVDYDRRPYDYDRRPPDYDRRSTGYDGRPHYDRWNRGWDRRPYHGRGEYSHGWGPPPYARRPPYNRGGPPPHSRGRGPPVNDKQPPYVINLNFDSRNTFPNGTIRYDNETITDQSNIEKQNPAVYETLKSIFNPKSGEALSNNDEEKSNAVDHHTSTVHPGLFQVRPITPAE